jgi:hypothetical protein
MLPMLHVQDELVAAPAVRYFGKGVFSFAAGPSGCLLSLHVLSWTLKESQTAALFTSGHEVVPVATKVMESYDRPSRISDAICIAFPAPLGTGG